MGHPKIQRILACAVSLLLLIGAFGISPAWADEAVGKITHLAGLLSALRPDGQTRLLGVQSPVSKGDVLSTEANAYARIKFLDNSEVVLRPNSQLKIDDFNFSPAEPEKDGIALSMFKGGLRAVSGLVGKRSPENVRFATPTATIGIRGTHFGALFCQSDCAGVAMAGGGTPPNGLHVDVVDGSVSLTNPGGSVVLNAGQFGFVPTPTAPPSIVPPGTGTRITLPSNITRNAAGGRSVGNGLGADCVAQ